MREKLGKYLAHCGVASRRATGELIEKGYVRVDGKVEANPAAWIDADVQEITYRGEKIVPEKLFYYMLNKPRGFVCTNNPKEDERSALELVPNVGVRLYTVGRLDKDSEGLILITNDGRIANVLTHPRFKVPKTYRVDVSGRIEAAHAEELKSGFWLDGRKTNPAKIRITYRGRMASTFDMTIDEGHNRQIRRCLARIGLKVRRLKRIRVGRLELRGLGPGHIKTLNGKEIEYLYGLVAQASAGTQGKVKSNDDSRTGKKRRDGRRGVKGRQSRGPKPRKSP